ncbi:MAG: hypothetical protein OXR64_00125 [Chloroflexota bacterium]|nr:hypothetical protein [Chloroflexota bacterium]MDE2918235.1 hypothetical protein [Chloroflexota bacterium]
MPSQSSYSSRRVARDFLRRIREVYKLVTASELSDAWLGHDVLIVGHGVSPSSRRGQPVLLSNGMYLNVELTLRVYRSPVPRLETVRATYSYQAGNLPHDLRPVFSYQFDRETRFPYPRCHLHVYASPTGYAQDRAFSRLHLPTRRITLEQIVWHLIQDHGVQPRRPDWHHVLWRHETRFRDTQRTQPWPYDPPFPPPDST